MSGKQPFDIHEVIARIRNAGRPAARSFDQDALFTLAQEGFDTPFAQQIACLIYICTGIRPRCAACPVLAFCRQVGVTEHR